MIRLHPSVPTAWAKYCVDVGADFRTYLAGFLILEGADAVNVVAHGFESLHARVLREAAMQVAA